MQNPHPLSIGNAEPTLCTPQLSFLVGSASPAVGSALPVSCPPVLVWVLLFRYWSAAAGTSHATKLSHHPVGTLQLGDEEVRAAAGTARRCLGASLVAGAVAGDALVVVVLAPAVLAVLREGGSEGMHVA